MFDYIDGYETTFIFTIVGIFLLASLAIVIPYLLTLQRALERCAPESRAMPPGRVWLLLIPLFNMVWHFLVVLAISKSLRNEFVRRNVPNAPLEPGKTLGLAMCILQVCGVIPVLGLFTSLAGMVCWIVYWVKVSDFSRDLQRLNLAGTGMMPPSMPPVRY